MTSVRLFIINSACMIVLSACSSTSTYQQDNAGDPPMEKLSCAENSPGDSDPTDGGVGGTGKQLEDCDDAPKSE